MMERQGAGDRWLAGQPVPGVRFAHHAPVEITDGRYAGRAGLVELLLNLDADPEYLVHDAADGTDMRVRQSSMRSAV